MKTLIQKIAAELWRIHKPNTHPEWVADAKRNLQKLAAELPSGSGLDNGTGIDVDASRPDKIVLLTAFHHMNEDGMYDGWTEHKITVKPSFVFGLDIAISGRDRNEIKEYLAQAFDHALSK